MLNFAVVTLFFWRSDIIEILNCTETENCIHFWVECCQKYTLFRKNLQIKVFRHRISDKEVRKGICLSSPGVDLGVSKDDMLEKSEIVFLSFPVQFNISIRASFEPPSSTGGGG